MNISVRPGLLLLLLSGNPTFQNFSECGAKGLDATYHAIKGMALTDAESTHLTSSGAKTNRRVQGDPGEHQDSPHQGTSRNRNRLHGTDLSQVEALVLQVDALQASMSKRLVGLESCACIPTCTTLASDDPAGLRLAIEETIANAGRKTVTLCPSTTVQWNSSDPLTENDLPLNFTLQCDAGAGESEDCVLDGGGTSSFVSTSITSGLDWAFQGITFHNGSSDSSGGAVWLRGKGSKLKIDDCRFEGNKAVHSGGAIALSFGAHLEATNCQFEDNKARFGGAVSIGIPLSFISADFAGGGNEFLRNTAQFGGALYVSAESTVDLCSGDSHVENMFEGNGDGTNGGTEDYLLHRAFSFNAGGSIIVPSTANCSACAPEITADNEPVVGVVVPCQTP